MEAMRENMFTPLSWSNWGSSLGTLMLIGALLREFLPFSPGGLLRMASHRVYDALYPYAQIKIDDGSHKIYGLVSTYLEAKSSESPRKLKANLDDTAGKLNLTMDTNEEIKDEFKGATICWSTHTDSLKPTLFAFNHSEPEETRHYILTYNKRQRKLIIEEYLQHVLEQAKSIDTKNCRRKLFTNKPCWEHDPSYRLKKRVWSSVTFEHPATFHMVAMDHEKKAEILEDFDFYRTNKSYYSKIGKAWKRGYLLYGPPGMGKSTLIAAIANYMDYDIYDLELTSVNSNTQLRKLLNDTRSKSVLVIEDIDCSVNLTAKCKKKKMEEEEASDEADGMIPQLRGQIGDTRVTLSGLLNFIDGLWSSGGEERIIIFTTNHIENLDPALIRTGRMDKHIEMSYCTREAFTVLAKNFLDLESHPLFEEVKELIDVHGVQITPADVSETLMPRTPSDKDTKAPSLEKLIGVMKKKKKVKDGGELTETTLEEEIRSSISEDI